MCGTPPFRAEHRTSSPVVRRLLRTDRGIEGTGRCTPTFSLIVGNANGHASGALASLAIARRELDDVEAAVIAAIPLGAQLYGVCSNAHGVGAGVAAA